MSVRILSFFFLFGFFLLNAAAQQHPISVTFTSRVDTSKKDVKEILLLWTNYLNSRPDSLYDNPYWNAREKQKYLAVNFHFDRASWLMYSGYNANLVLRVYKPRVLDIEPVGDKYCIQTLFYSDTMEKKYRSQNPIWITKYYALKESGKWKLENLFSAVTKDWIKYKTKNITYYYSPSFAFNTFKAENASRFIDSVVTAFNLFPPQPVDYYISATGEEFSALYNMDFWLNNSNRISHWPVRQVCAVKETFYHPHDFIAVLFNPSAHWILAEGVATWLAGTGTRDGVTYKEELHDFANEIKDKVTLTFNDLYSRKYYHQSDNNPLTLTGAFIIDLVYRKKGISGVTALLSDKSDDLYALIEKHTGIPRNDIDFKLMEMIKQVAGK